MQIRQMGAELYRAYRQTYKTKQIATFRGFANPIKTYFDRAISHAAVVDQLS